MTRGVARRLAAAGVLCAFVLQGCGAGWHQPADLTPGALPARQQVQVWRGGSAQRWHAVMITNDSVSGIYYLQPIDCDSCRLSVPRSAVDSIQVGHPVAGFWKTFGLAVGIPAAILFVVCATRGPCTND